jgi:hypothetical protein
MKGTAAPLSGRERLILPLQLALLGLAVAGALWPAAWLGGLAAAVLVAFLALCLADRPGVTTLFTLVSAALAVDALATGRGAVLLEALSRGALFAALFTALSMLQAPAAGSGTLLRAGRMFIAQPPRRRYATLSLAGHLFGVVLNIGTLAMLGTMIRRATEPAPGAPACAGVPPERRRALIAMLRGFVTMPLWSPLSVAPAVLLAITPGMTYGAMALQALGVALAFFLVGWAMDARRAEAPAAAAPVADAPEGWRPMAGLLGIIGLLVAAVLGVWALTGLQLPQAATLAIPPAALGWMLLRALRDGGDRAGRRSAARQGALQLARGLPRARREAVMMACAGFLSVAVPGLAPTEALAAALAGIPNVGLFLPVAVMALIVAGAMVGITPLVGLALLGAIVAGMPGLGIRPEVMLGAYMCGWSISAQTSPWTANTMMMGLAADVPPTAIMRWNARYALVMLALSAAALIAAGLLPGGLSG